VGGERSTTLRLPRWLGALLSLGPVALYLAATAYGVLEAHSSTDTWIGLAAGRQILTATEFPKTDTFSHTFYGHIWYNQNWLTHLCQYWLYSRLGPNWVIYGTWALSASVFLLTLLASYWRSGTWLGAMLAAAVVALGCRDFLSARPATTGFFCIAALWALLCALEGQGGRVRWWPIPLLLPLLLLWGNAHGSFVFGYAVLALYIGHWFVLRTIRLPQRWISLGIPLAALLIGGVLYSIVPREAAPSAGQALKIGAVSWSLKKLALTLGMLAAYAIYWLFARSLAGRPAISDRQAAVLVGVVGAALVLTALLSPFGIENFTHARKIAGSEVFRQVSEWWPPTARGRHFPPVWRFWVILGASLGLLAACGLIRLAGPRGTARPAADGRLRTSALDFALIAIGLSMTFWARRFAPLYFIFGAPIFLTWIIRLLRPLPQRSREYLRLGVMACAGLLAVLTIWETTRKAYGELVEHYAREPQFNLLERVTRYDATPHEAILYLRENRLDVNLLVEWTQAGPVMFYAPNAKVFMDGRAQQVYDEDLYRKYANLMVTPDTPRQYIARVLAEHNTDGVLLRRGRTTENLWRALEQSGEWVPVLLGIRYGHGLFFRKGSRALEQVAELLRRGQEWRPNVVGALLARGFVWAALDPPDLTQAVLCWQGAVDQDVGTGAVCFRPLVRALLDSGRTQEARDYVQKWYRELSQPQPDLPEQNRRELLRILADCWQYIETPPGSGPNRGAGG